MVSDQYSASYDSVNVRFGSLADIRRNHRLRLLSGAKQTFLTRLGMSYVDPQETLALPQNFEHGSLATLREKPIKIDTKDVRHGR